MKGGVEMSELTICNYCSYKAMKARAKKAGRKIRLVASKEMSGWMAVKEDGKEIAWYMEMTDKCAC